MSPRELIAAAVRLVPGALGSVTELNRSALDVDLVAVVVAVGVGPEADRDIAVVDAEQLVHRRLAAAPVGKLALWKWPLLSQKPELSLFMLALFIEDQNPTVTPLSFSPVTWVCAEPGKFSLT